MFIPVMLEANAKIMQAANLTASGFFYIDSVTFALSMITKAGAVVTIDVTV